MANEIKHILEPYFQRLPELRGSPSLWQEFKCLQAADKDGHFIDANHCERTNLLISLFYDQRASDENLLRFLLRQETEMHRHLPLQGVDQSLKISVALLSRFRNVNNIELLIETKEANFDTRCTLDAISFVSPGVAKSYDHLPNLSAPHRRVFIDSLGPTAAECRFSEEDASQWVDNQADILPAPLEKLSLENEIYLADLLGNGPLLNSKITDWIASIKKWDKETCLALFNYETMRGNVQGRITALKKIGEYEAEKTLEKQMNLYHLSGLYLEVKNINEAYKHICASLQNHTESMQWGDFHLYADRFLDIILASKDRNDPRCVESFRWLKAYLDYQPWMENWDIRIIPRIMTASTIVGDNDTMKKFSELFRARKAHSDTSNK